MGKTMITGAHTIIYSTDPVADRSFFRDVLDLAEHRYRGWLAALRPASVGSGGASFREERRP